MTTAKDPTHDIHWQLRDAADKCNLREVKRLAQIPGIDINRCGPKSGQTALHRAASKGHYDIIEYLIAQGADSRNTDIGGKTPADLAPEAQIKTLLEVAYPLQQAVVYAKRRFPLAVDTRNDDGTTIEQLRGAIDRDMQAFKLEMKYVVDGCTYDKAQTKLFIACMEHTFYLTAIKLTLQNEAHEQGFALERSLAAAGFLIANGYRENIEVIEVTYNRTQLLHDVHSKMKGRHVTFITKEENTPGHIFLAARRPINANASEYKNSNMIICDPYQANKNVYHISTAPKESCVSALDYQYYEHKPMFTTHRPKQPEEHPELFPPYYLFEAQWNELEEEIGKLIPFVDLKEPLPAARLKDSLPIHNGFNLN